VAEVLLVVRRENIDMIGYVVEGYVSRGQTGIWVVTLGRA
jgi:hypothetical protein